MYGKVKLIYKSIVPAQGIEQAIDYCHRAGVHQHRTYIIRSLKIYDRCFLFNVGTTLILIFDGIL